MEVELHEKSLSKNYEAMKTIYNIIMEKYHGVEWL